MLILKEVCFSIFMRPRFFTLLHFGSSMFLPFDNHRRKSFWQGIYLLFALIPLFIGAMGFLALFNSPYLGIGFESKDGKWFVSSVDPYGPAAKHPELAGKEILSIGDLKIRENDLGTYVDDIRTAEGYRQFWDAQQYFFDHITVGSPVSLIVEGARVSLIPSSYPWIKAVSGTMISHLVLLISLLIGLVVGFKKPEDPRVRVFVSMVFSMSLYIASNAAYASREIVFNDDLFRFLAAINSLAGIYIGVAMLHFFMIFPRENQWARNRLFLLGLYLLPILVTIIYQMRISWFSHYIYTFACLLGGFGFLIHTFLHLRSAEEKGQVKWVLYGMGLFLVLALALHLFPILMGHRLFRDSDLFVLILLPPLSIAFAIMKYRLMDIDTLFDNTLIYSATLGVLAFIDITVISVLTNLKILNFSINQPVAVIAGVWVIIYTYVPVRDFIRNRIRKLLKREVYDINQVSLQLSRDLLSATDIQTSFDKVMVIIQQSLHPKGGETYLFDQKGVVPFATDEAGAGISFEDIKKIIEPVPLFEVYPPDSLPSNYTGGVVVPVIGTQEHLGCIILQNKHSDRLYDREDVKLLNIAAGQLALHIEALREIKRKEQETFLEKERISREIHDGIGSSFTKAILIADMMGQKSPECGDHEFSRELRKTLAEGLTELRTLVWAVDERECSLQDLVLQISESLRSFRENGGIALQFHRKVVDDDRIAPPLLRRSILRIIDEALTNIIKHAGASRVEISLIYDGSNLTLRIRDDGKGCRVTGSNSPGNGLANMRKRCEEMGGRFTFTTAPQQGTEILLEVNF